MKDLLTDKETATILGISRPSLYKIVKTFDSDLTGKWKLEEGKDFEFVTRNGRRSRRARRFTEAGVEAIAAYIEKDKNGFLDFIKELLTRRRIKRKKTLVSRRITQEFVESAEDFIIKNELAFVPKKSTIYILQTNGIGYKNTLDRLRKEGSAEGPEALEIDKHFVLIEEERLWSQKGIARMAINMREKSSVKKSRARTAWMDAVGLVVEDCFKREIKRLKAAPKNIDKAISAAKRATGETCEVTGRKRTQGNRLQLDGHHLFDRNTRPDLADLHENILVVEGNVHSDFHSWKGAGKCEPKDFLEYLDTCRLDLVDLDDSASARRYNKLVVRLENLQKNFKDNHLRYQGDLIRY
ncbi:hypothetical protein [Prochlorococcus sp. MIT 1307]|uniref:hypothetical protein n=1 Tax=Prochlorococcus sp. MIT 1307 TaxID=3096219 RepID=UPI002A748F03|nr:hypothetical protein [Prochlorococcus sp. MIT 1307]